MLNDALIISLSRNFWDDVWRSRQQVMSRLARTNKVVFVSRPLHVDEILPWARPHTTLRGAGVHRVHENLFAYVPPRYLPTIFRMPKVERLLDGRRRAELRRFVQRWKGQPPVLYLWHPGFEKYMDTFPESVVCYHLFDDLSMYGEQGDQAAERALERIFSRADLVFAASEELADRYKRFGNVHWVPNGVDYETYAGADAHGTPVPTDLQRVPGRRLGYAGSLRAQIDIDLLARVAAARPEWSIVLIGDVSNGTAESAAFRDLRLLPNVHVLGPKPMHEMPTYLRHLDVGLLPYRLDGAARFCYPLKMHEYLAAGLPVVSSGISAVRQFTSVIRVADTPEEWISAIERSLSDTDPARVAERQRVASDNSWNQRVDRIGNLIAGKLQTLGLNAHLEVDQSRSMNNSNERVR